MRKVAKQTIDGGFAQIRRQPLVVILLASFALGLVSCRSKMSVKTATSARSPAQTPAGDTPSDGASSPTGEISPNASTGANTEPKFVASGFDEARLQFQTRSVITLKLNSELVGPGSSFSLLNDTNGQSLIENEPVSLSLAPSDLPFQLLSQARGYDIILKLYPLDPTFRGKLAYGENRLKVLVDADSDPQFSTTTIQLQDFDVQGLGTIAPSDTDGAIEMWSGSFGRPVVSANDSVLTTSLETMIND